MTPQRFNPYKQFKGSFIPLWLLERAEISPGAKLIYARLALHAGEDGDRAFPGIVTLAKEIGLPWTEAKELPDGTIRAADSRSVRAYLKELVEKGLIESVQQGFNRPNRYYFLRHEWMKDGLDQGSADFAGPARQGMPFMSGNPCRLKQTVLKDSELKDSEKEKTTTNNVVVVDVQNVVYVQELTDAGFSEKQARDLLQRHPLDKIREMISYGREKRAKNLAGFVIRGLSENWQIPAKVNRFDEGIVRTNKKTSYLEQARLHTIRKYGIDDEPSGDSGIIRSNKKTSYLRRDGFDFEIGDLVRTGEKIGKIEGIEQKNGKIKVIARTHDDQIFSFEKNLES